MKLGLGSGLWAYGVRDSVMGLGLGLWAYGFRDRVMGLGFRVMRVWV